jgi:hypothetical protein
MRVRVLDNDESRIRRCGSCEVYFVLDCLSTEIRTWETYSAHSCFGVELDPFKFK